MDAFTFMGHAIHRRVLRRSKSCVTSNFLFQALGKGRSYRFLGEHTLIDTEIVSAPSTSKGHSRKAIVFLLRQVGSDEQTAERQSAEPRVWIEMELENTSAMAMREVRTKQALFRDNVLRVESACRISEAMIAERFRIEERLDKCHREMSVQQSFY